VTHFDVLRTKLLLKTSYDSLIRYLKNVKVVFFLNLKNHKIGHVFSNTAAHLYMRFIFNVLK